MDRVQEVRLRLAGIPDPTALLAGFFAFSPVALQIYTADGHCLLTNQAFRDLFGSEPPPDYNVLEDEIAAERGVLDLVRRSFQGETVYVPPIWYDPRDLRQVEVREGNRVAIESTFFPLLDQEGRVTHVAIVFKDVTNEKLALERAEAERALLSSVVEQMPEGVIIVEAHSGKILVRNARSAELIGGRDAELRFIGDYAAYKLLHRDGHRYQPDEYPISRAIRSGETVDREQIEFEHDDGTRGVLRASAAPVRDAEGRTIAGVSVFEDATQEHRLLAQIEAARQEAERERARLHALFMQAPALIGITRGADHVFELANPLLERVIGHSNLVGQSARRVIQEKDGQTIVDTLDYALKSAAAYAAREFRVVFDRGEGRTEENFLDLVVQPVFDHGGGIGGLMIHAVDVGDAVHARKRAEALAGDLEQAVKVRDTFLSIASHELKTPLTALTLSVQQLLRNVKRGSFEVAKLGAKLELVARQCQRLEALTDDLLDVSRITSGRLEVRWSAVDLSALAREVAERFQALSSHTPIVVQAPSAVIGNWDPTHVEHVLANLLSNAIKYGAGKPIEIEVQQHGDRALCSVRDRGIGIDPAEQARIFERFERVASEHHYGGFGLGLWIARQMIDALGGSIRVESALGSGSTFHVELPLARESAG